MSSWRPWLLLVCAVLGACTGADESLPTLAPMEAASPTVEATLTDAAPLEPTATATLVRVRPTLPPTFTPTPSPTVEPSPTLVFPSATPFVSAATPDPNCNQFTVNFEASTSQFNIGEAPTIAWNGIPGAELYRIIIRTENERVVTDQIYIAETTYRLPPNLFTPGVVYGWEVYPINARSDQMCFAVGSILIPVTPIPIPGG